MYLAIISQNGYKIKKKIHIKGTIIGMKMLSKKLIAFGGFQSNFDIFNFRTLKEIREVKTINASHFSFEKY